MLKFTGTGQLPDVGSGFFLVLNSANWSSREKLVRQIFATVSPQFQPFLPLIEDRAEYVQELNCLFEQHGLKIRVLLE